MQRVSPVTEKRRATKLKNDPMVHGFRWRRHGMIEEEMANLL